MGHGGFTLAGWENKESPEPDNPVESQEKGEDQNDLQETQKVSRQPENTAHLWILGAP
jgi:hypothetical protein